MRVRERARTKERRRGKERRAALLPYAAAALCSNEMGVEWM